MIGKRFSRLVVLSFAGVLNEKRQWLCQCDCGNQTVVITKRLNSGHTRSCGCLQREVCAAQCASRATHGLTKSRTYSSWMSMKERCLNPKAPNYFRYGAKGITVCDRWRDSFENFLADMGVRPGSTSLDRIDNAKGYEPGNCRWATPQQQTDNRARKSGWKIPNRKPRALGRHT